MKKTYIRPPKHSNRDWLFINCKNLSLGRLASMLVPHLTGKNAGRDYHPCMDYSTYVVLYNAKDIIFNSNIDRFHVYQPGHPGKSLKQLKNTEILPKQIIENCVFNMLPNGFSKKHLSKLLKIYLNDNHPHTGQLINSKDKIKYKNY